VALEDDSSISEINILPDGRVCLFGASRQVLELLDAIPLGDPTLKTRLDCLQATTTMIVEPPRACVARTDQGTKQ
jgi:hypothetical protein